METNHIIPKTVAVVKRKWHQPEIHAFINKQEVGSMMEMNDFIRALVDEMYGEKNRFFNLTKAEALAKALEAKETILREMKLTTSHVV